MSSRRIGTAKQAPANPAVGLGGHDGSARNVADAAGGFLRHLRYAPFGSVIEHGGPTTPSEDPLYLTDQLPRHGYTGHAHEWQLASAQGAGGGEDGLVFMNARPRDLNSGRFVSHDPIGFYGGLGNL